MTQRAGYAVIDVETTGLRPSWHHRVVEVGVVHLDAACRVTGEWVTLVNPERDLGPQHIHRIEAADVRHAPTFAEIAGDLAGLLRGRVVVAHNLPFDAGFLAYEFARLGYRAPLDHGVCTMRWAGRLLPGAPRSLAGCCRHVGIPLDGQHSALVDARASAALLRTMLADGVPPGFRGPEPEWPELPAGGAAWVARGAAAVRDRHFLERIIDRLPRVATHPAADPYLALLDRALLDRHISATEADELVALAGELGLDRATAGSLHRGYLDALAVAAWEDGVVTGAERHELHTVAALLGIPADAADLALAAARDGAVSPAGRRPAFALAPGDLVVFTGEMREDRTVWEDRARAAGLRPHGSVTRKVRLVVAADPDSLSGKARKARQYAIPIVTPDAFADLIKARG